MSPLPVITSPRLAERPGVRHAFFTRQGGVSTGIYDSLNVGRGSSDDPAAVEENRRRIGAHFGVDAGAVLACYQIHSAIVRTAEEPWGDLRPEGDAIVTVTPGLVCGAMTADCAPVLLADVQAGVVASAHAGWKGAIGGVVEATVAAMVAAGASPGGVTAVVGPCIGPDSYEVGPEFRERFEVHDPDHRRWFREAETPGKFLFDLPGFVLSRLEAVGVNDCEWTGHDTLTDEARFFSNRRAFQRGEPDYGRLLSAIALT